MPRPEGEKHEQSKTNPRHHHHRRQQSRRPIRQVPHVQRPEGREEEPCPTLRIANVTRFIQPYLTAYNDLVGARLTRTLTFDKYLDSGTSPDSSQVFGACVYIVEQKTKQTKSEVEFTLSSIIDAPLFKLPRGQVLRTVFPGAGLFRKN
jgi:lambda family phage minor tail protein L